MQQQVGFVPITKIDERRRTISGVLAEEAVDKSAEIMDYAKSKSHFEDWSNTINAASGGKSKGNVREMHTLSAVGKVTKIAFDDAAKHIPITVEVVDEDAWRKCVTGVYNGFSVGGSYGDKWIEKGHKRYVAKPTEVSLVDNPCMYGATFTIAKADGTESLRKFVGIQGATEKVVVDVTKAALATPNDLDKILDAVREVVGADQFAKINRSRLSTESRSVDGAVQFLVKIAPVDPNAEPLAKVVEENDDGKFVVMVDGEVVGEPYDTKEAADEALAAIEADAGDDEGEETPDAAEGDDATEEEEEAAKAALAPTLRKLIEVLPKGEQRTALEKMRDDLGLEKDATTAVANAEEAIEALKLMIANMALLDGNPDTWALSDILAAIDSAIWAKGAAQFEAAEEITTAAADDSAAAPEPEADNTLAAFAGGRIRPMLKAAKITGDKLDTFAVALLHEIMGGREIALGKAVTLEATTDEGYLSTLTKVADSLAAVKDALQAIDDKSLGKRIEAATESLTASIGDLTERLAKVESAPAAPGRKVGAVDKTVNGPGLDSDNTDPIAKVQGQVDELCKVAAENGAPPAAIRAIRLQAAAAIMPH